MPVLISPDRTKAIAIEGDFTASFINGGWINRLVFDESETASFIEVIDQSARVQLLQQAQQQIHSLGTGHLAVFSDGCPSDFLEKDAQSTRWHTIVFSVLQIKGAPCRLDDGTIDVCKIVDDEYYKEFFAAFRKSLPSPRKWDGGRSPAYKTAFATAFAEFKVDLPIWINAVSFQEYTLRSLKEELVRFYNRRSWTEHEIGFAEFVDDRGRYILQHEYVDMNGYHKLSRRVEHTLVLLLMACCLMDQHLFYFKNIVIQDRHYSDVVLTLISDTLSGDDEKRRDAEYILHHLVDRHYDSPFAFGRSPGAREEDGDIFVDNIAGWLNHALHHPKDELADLLFNGDTPNRLAGWRILDSSRAISDMASAWDWLRQCRT